MKKFDKADLSILSQLMAYSDVYEINIQFWPKQTTVYIAKDGIELTDYGGDYTFAIVSSLDYLIRINKNQKND